LPITVFSQFSVDCPRVDEVVRIQPEGDGFYDKARTMLDSPYQRTIFIDADIYVTNPFWELFDLLDRFDCAANHEEYSNTDWDNHYPRPDVPASFPEYNTGILVYKRSPTLDRMLIHWGQLYREFLEQNPGKAINDQPFFRVAAYFGDSRIATLGREYNCKFRGQGYLNREVKLLHGHVRFQMNPRYMQRVAGIINASQRPRVYVGGKVFEQRVVGRLWSRRKAKLVGQFPEPEPLMTLRVKRAKDALRKHGVMGILRRLIRLPS
jgi:hypothetical protein